MRLLWLLLLVSSLGCGLEGVLSSAQTSTAITDGQEDPLHPAVGKLIFSLSGGTAQDGACTAILVGSQTVLSAAHCLVYDNTELLLDDGQRSMASRTLVHPDYDPQKPYLNDLGLAFLDEPLQVTPMRVDPGTVEPGTAVVLVGYGRTDAHLDDQGIKRVTSNTIASVKPDYLTIVGTGDGVGNACHGDSGGPVLVQQGDEECIVGLLSYITDYSHCGTTTYATRLDLFSDWLQQESDGDVLQLDRQPPQLTFVKPSAGETAPARLTVELEVSDNQTVEEVMLQVDGLEQGSVTAAPYVFSLQLEPGQHELHAFAWDAQGNQGDSVMTVQVDSSASSESGCNLAKGRLPSSGLSLLFLLGLLALLERRSG